MSRLRDRQKQVPGGMFFYEPSTGWRSTPWASFDVIVSEIIAHRRGNPALAQKNNWAMDRASVANELDAFLSVVCEKMGWMDFIDSGVPSPPKFTPQHLGQSRLLSVAAGETRMLAAGYKAIRSWSADGFPPLTEGLAEKRAAVCVACPKNDRRPLVEWFTIPFAEAIRRDAEQLRQKGLTTSLDDRLHTCTACHCPLVLKVQIPFEPYIAQTLTLELEAKLREGKDCWILKEAGK